jgi:RNA polymerase sigma factor (sigma-70 family)
MAGYAVPLEPEDRLIGASLQTDDREAFDVLYRRYAAPLRDFCRSRLGGSYREAEDACHEALIKAHQALPRFRRGARVWPWLATIAAHVCIDLKRAESRFSAIEDCPDQLEHGPEAEAERRIRGEILADALQNMPTKYRDYLQLREFDGWTYEQIASFFGVSVSAVKSVLLRARRVLRHRVEEIARERNWPIPVIVPPLFDPLRKSLRRTWLAIQARIGSTDSFPSFAPTLANTLAVIAVVIAGVTHASASPSTAVDQQSGPAASQAVSIDVSGSELDPSKSDPGQAASHKETSSAPRHASPEVTAAADIDGNGKETVVVVPGVVVDCGPRESRGQIMSLACDTLGSAK